MSKIHIIIPVLNCVEMTNEAIASIQTKHDYQVLVIDQCSTDATKSTYEEHPDIMYQRYDPSVCLSEAWNYGIKLARKDKECEYIFVPNNDVIFHKKTIDNLVEAMDRLSYAMVTGNNVQPEMSLEDMNNKDHGSWDHDERPITNWREEGPDFSCFLIKPDFVEKYGWFDEHYKPAYYEDNDCHQRIIKGGGHAKRISKAPYYHIASQTILKNPQIAPHIAEGQRRNSQYFVKKWGSSPPSCLDGAGFNKPFNDSSKDHRWWEGCEKYNEQ